MIDEDDLIARHFAPLAGPGGLGLTDDAAIFSPPAGCQVVLTKDALVAGVHFFADDPPQSIARKALTVNLSDLAAKGADPAGFLLALALPDGIDEGWIAAFAEGLGHEAKAHGCPLLGGDTVRAQAQLVLSITAIGTCPEGAMVRRSGGRAGHRLMVTGSIGDSALGVRLRLTPEAPWVRGLSEASRGYLADRYLHPQPRTAFAAAIRQHARAAMDVSDGLLGDALKLARASSGPQDACAPMIDLARLPLSDAACEALALDPQLISAIATGGDDYEVLMAVQPEDVAAVTTAGSAAGLAITDIGELVHGTEARFVGRDGAPARFGRLKYEHSWGA